MDQQKLIYMHSNRNSKLMSNIEELEQQNLELKNQITIRNSTIWELKKRPECPLACSSTYK